ncbi:MAG TPA: DUF2330 domain-containing protein [Actinomycetota bacterium]
MTRRVFAVSVLTVAIALVPAAAFACGGLVAPNGAVNLLRTTTLAGYHDGVEHYVTSFTFGGVSSGSFGSLVPLPGEPTDVVRGGDWTLQRLIKEVTPQPRRRISLFATAAGVADSAEVILETKIDALDITVLKGGADEVGVWAGQNGFKLSPDAPEVLDFYASRSPYFMAAKFDAGRAAELGQGAGDGTPVHITIPTGNPWVPLRILALGKGSAAPVQADLFLLTDVEPATLPAPKGTSTLGLPQAPGLTLARSEQASDSLIEDLRSDKGMDWIPETGMWLSYVKIDARARDVTYDLAIDASGRGEPSWIAAGLRGLQPADIGPVNGFMLGSLLGALLIAVVFSARRIRSHPAGL